MIHELDRVILNKDLPEHGLERGDIGTVVLIHRNHAGYEVEFNALDGEPVAIVSLYPSELRPIGRREIAHARAVNVRVLRRDLARVKGAQYGKHSQSECIS